MSWRPYTTSRHLDEALSVSNPSHCAFRLTILNYNLETLNGRLEATVAATQGWYDPLLGAAPMTLL
jgi:hypothetical protein